MTSPRTKSWIKLTLIGILSLTLALPSTREILTGDFQQEGYDSDLKYVSSTSLLAEQQFDTSIPLVSASNVTIDGIIGLGEYSESYDLSIPKLGVYWEHNGSVLTVGLVSVRTGWIAMGFGDRMENSNMIFGGVSNSLTYCLDLVGLPGWTHNNDTNQGGSYDILSCSATENATSTMLEFRIPMNPSDILDPVLEVNKTAQMFFAVSASDSFTAYHTGGKSQILNVLFRPELDVFQTQLTMTAPTSVHQGELFDIQALVQDERTIPVAGMNLTFIRKTLYGNYIIAVVPTNSTGGANITYFNDILMGNVSLGAFFEESLTQIGNKTTIFKQSEITTTITFTFEEIIEDRVRDVLFIPLTSKCCEGGLFYLLLLRDFLFYAALTSIWAIYAFNLLTVLRMPFIRKEKEVLHVKAEELHENPGYEKK